VVIDGGATAVSLVVSAEERVDAIAHMGRKIYLFSTLSVDYPEGIRLGISGRDIQAETLSGKSLSSPAPPPPERARQSIVAAWAEA
jgi:hypothetical protein